ncbi:MAG: hypothetical protein ACUVQQ_01275 [Thermogutta sp.]
MPYPVIDPLKLHVLPLAQRRNLLTLVDETYRSLKVELRSDPAIRQQIECLAKIMLAARQRRAAIMLTYGEQLNKNGVGPLLNRLIKAGGAIGQAAGHDARIFAASVDRLEGGVHVSIGCAIMSPQIFEKLFSAANGIRASEGRELLGGHCLVIVDLQDGGGWGWSRGDPSSTNPAYYLRFCKSFYRMVGTLDYIRYNNRVFLVHLLHTLSVTATADTGLRIDLPDQTQLLSGARADSDVVEATQHRRTDDGVGEESAIAAHAGRTH